MLQHLFFHRVVDIDLPVHRCVPQGVDDFQGVDDGAGDDAVLFFDSWIAEMPFTPASILSTEIIRLVMSTSAAPFRIGTDSRTELPAVR